MLRTLVLVSALCGCLSLPVREDLSDEDLSKYRLPKDVIPIQYTVLVVPYFPVVDTETEALFDGFVDISVKAVNNISKITLHANDMIIKKISVKNQINMALNFESDFSEMAKYDFIHLNLNESVIENETLDISIEYTGHMRSDMNGFYLSSYQDQNNKTYWIGTTQFEPVYARRAFPCFDEPGFKAKFIIKIQRPEGYKSLSNTVIDTSFGNLDVYQITEAMPTYLVAFVVSKLANSEGTPKTFNVWTRPEAKDQAKLAVNVGWNLVVNMSNYMGIDYTNDMKLAKLDMVALPDFSAGAMENWALLTYRETDLLWDDMDSTLKDLQKVTSVIAHELSHQWFGDLVTLHWWSDTWLNEGFATFFEYYLTDMLYPDMKMKEQFVIDEVQTAMAVDSLTTAQKLTNDAYTKNQINSMFGLISYNKGGSVLRMISYILGEDNFQKSLNDYINSHKFKTSHPTDLWDAMDKYNGTGLFEHLPVEKFAQNWFNQPGYPIVTAKLVGNNVILDQKHFLFPNNKTNNPNYQWYIPISYTTNMNFTNTLPTIMMEPNNTDSIPIDKKNPLVLNIQSTGYYRVQYDDNLLKRISEILNKKESIKKIHHLNKAMLVSDILNLARAGEVKYSTAFDFLNFLSNEDDYFTWASAFEGFRFLLQRFPENDATGKSLRTYLLNNMKTVLHDTNFENITDESDKYISTYNKVNSLQWACDLGHKDCNTQATNLFKDYKNNKNIDKNVRSIVYCTAMRNGSPDDWQFLWNKFLDSNVAAEKVRILNALGCSKNETLLNELLQLSVTPGSGIRKQDAMYVFSAVYSGNYEGVGIAMKFLKNNYLEMADNYGGMNALGDAINGLASRLTSNKEVEELDNFLNKNLQSLKDVEASGKDSIELAYANIHWSDTKQKEISDYLNKGKKSGASAVTVSTVIMGLVAALLLMR